MPDKALTYNVEMNLAQARTSAKQLTGIYQQELSRVDLRVLDTGLNQSQGEAKQLQTNLRGVTDEIERAGRASRNITTGGGAASGSGLGGLATGLIGGLTGYLATQGAQQIAQQAMSFAELGTQVRRADEAFDILSGSARTAEQRINAIQKASNNTVSELKAMEIGTQLVSLRLASTTEDFERLTRAGRQIALVSPTIKDLGEALTQLSLFAANEQSFARADQLGLATGEVRERMAELRAENENLDGSQAKLLASTQLLEEKFGAVLDGGSAAASGVEKFRVAIEDARNELAKGPLGRGIDSLFGVAAGGITGVGAQANRTAIDWATLLGAATLEDEIARIKTLITGAGSGSIEQGIRSLFGQSVDIGGLAKVVSAFDQIKNATDRGVPGLEDYRDVLAAIAQEAAKSGGVTESQARALDAIAVSVAQASSAYRDLQAAQVDTSAIDNLIATFQQLDILIADAGAFTPAQVPAIEQIQKALLDLKIEIAATGEVTDEQAAAISNLEGRLSSASSAVQFMGTAEGQTALATGQLNAELINTPGYLDAIGLSAERAGVALQQALAIAGQAQAQLTSGLSGLIARGLVTAEQAAQILQQQQGAATQGAFAIANGGGTPAEQAFRQAELQRQLSEPLRIIEENEKARLAAIREQEAAQKRAARETESAFKKAASEAEKAFKAAAAQLESDLRSTPGLFGASAVTQEQMAGAAAGLPQNFADNFIRRLRDEVENGKDWEGVSIDIAREALGRVGIVASDNAEAVVQQITEAWNNSSLFADPANLALINEEAVRANLDLQEKARQGQENILKHFGVVIDEAVAAATGGGAAGGVTPPAIGPPPVLPTGEQAALAGGAAGNFVFTVSPTAMSDITGALIEQAGAEQPRIEALGGLYGLYFANGIANRDFEPVANDTISGMATALAAQGDVIRGQGTDYASIMALGIAGYDFTSTAASAVIGLRSAFGTEENLNILLGTGGAIATFIRDGMTNEVNKPDWAQSLVDSIVAQILASASASLTEGV